MLFVDTHCHLNFSVFNDHTHEVVQRAIDAGVNTMIVPGLDLETSETAVELTTRYKEIFAAVGVHPNEVRKWDDNQEKIFHEFLKERKVLAVGEIGLDFYRHPENKELQAQLLARMLEMASTFNKPVILHSRNSLTNLLGIIKEWIQARKNNLNNEFGIFHGFEGSQEQAVEVTRLNMRIGIGGPVTFKNAVEKQELVRKLELQHIVLETDSPLLSPHPYRGQTNEPSRIPVIAQKIAELHQVELEEVAQITTSNAKSLFRWDEIH